ncbi:MAG: VTT domain-containing protein [Acidimicrobiales bacterium]|nr:VTT domain-containing protein [Acidimicrobiales bacterium]
MDELGEELVEDFEAGRGGYLRGVLVALLVVGVVVIIIQTGLFGRFTDQEELRRTVDDAGVWGPAVFLALMIVLVPLSVPGLIFVIPSTTLFGTVGGFTVSMIGGFIGSAIGIVAARRLGRSVFESKMPARVLAMESRLSERGIWVVIGIRCFVYLLQPFDWLLGVSRMPLRTVLVGTFIGLIPMTLIVALTGGGLIDLIL